MEDISQKLLPAKMGRSTMHCNPTQGLKKLGGKRHNPGLANPHTIPNKQAWSESAVTQKKHSTLPRSALWTIQDSCHHFRGKKHSSICHRAWLSSAAATDTWLGSTSGNSHKKVCSMWNPSITSIWANYYLISSSSPSKKGFKSKLNNV